MPKLGAVVIVVVVAAWLGGSGTALAKKPPRPRAPGALVPQTGQTTSFVAGDDGELQEGVLFPSPRFTDEGDGTVRDNLTGLIWLKNALCFSGRAWALAVSTANGLTSGQCALADGSVAGDWRLPNVRELHTLIDFGFFGPALSDAAGTTQWTDGDVFLNVRSSEYWSSTTYAGSPDDSAWSVDLGSGNATVHPKADGGLVWAVRGPTQGRRGGR